MAVTPPDALVPRDLCLDLGDLGTLCLERELSEGARQVAREELNETDDDTTAAKIEELRQMLQKEKGLKLPPGDRFLTGPLRTCHWFTDSALERAKNFYAFKARYPQVGRVLRPEKLEMVASLGVAGILPRRDQFGRRILLLQTGYKWDTKKASMEDILCLALMFLEVALVEPDTQVQGVVIVWDLDGLSLSQVLKFTPSFAKMLVYLIQDCVPLRVKAFHFINQSNLFDLAFKVIKPFLKDKLRSRLFSHGKDMTTLTDHLDPKVLPKEYGGMHNFNFNPVGLINAIRKFDKYFEELAKYGYEKPPK